MSVRTVALVWRMLANGVSPGQVAEATGVDLDDVLDLKMEMPS
jgi:hypothetical protein